MLKSKSPQIGKTLEFKQVARIKLLVRQYQLYIKFYNKYVGLLVKPDVHTVGTQCSLSQMHSSVQDVGIQCSLLAPVRSPTSVRLPYASSPLPSDTSQSESEISQCDYETPDLDTSAYTLQDDSSP